jgi:hypothetical protein
VEGAERTPQHNGRAGALNFKPRTIVVPARTAGTTYVSNTDVLSPANRTGLSLAPSFSL